MGQQEDNDRFLDQIKKNIVEALSENDLKVYNEVLFQELNKLPAPHAQVQKCDPESIAKGLIDGLVNGGRGCPIINRVLQKSVLRCFDGVTDRNIYEKTEPYQKLIGSKIEVILGNLALFMVDDRDACDLSEWLGDDLSGLYFELQVKTLGGVELFISKRHQRSADLELSGRDVVGKHLIVIDSSPQSWHHAAMLNDLQLTIWSIVFDENDRLEPLDEDDLDDLQSEIDTRKEIPSDRANYCVVMKFDPDESDKNCYKEACQKFLSQLQIPLVRYRVRVSGDQKPFNGMEQHLMKAIKHFLNTTNKYISL